MQLSCPCFNVTLNVVEDESFNDAAIKLDLVKQEFGEDVAGDPFFALCERGDISQFVLLSENGIIEKLSVLIRRRYVDNKWEVRRCLICGADAYALRSNASGGQVLVNTKLFIRDIALIDELRKSPEISPVFQVVLPKGIIPSAVELNGHGYSNGASTTVLLSRGVLRAVQTSVSQYLTQEQEAMDERIRLYIDEQQNAFERLKENVKAEKTSLLRFIAQNGVGVGNEFGNSGTMEDDIDSAVPLSPLSLTSGDPSPGLPATAMGAIGFGDAVYSHVNGTLRGIGGGLVHNDTPLRPKALSNPASLAGWKRKRHSGGGNNMAPVLASHTEEQQDIFSFDEQEAVEEPGNQTYLLADDEGDATGDSGNGEDSNKCYPAAPGCNTKYGLIGPNQVGVFRQYGPSLPMMGAPATASYGPVTAAIQESSAAVFHEENIDQFAEKPSDVGASMHALALSMKGADDPERLFGERPQRRRWKTGEDRQQPRQRNNSVNIAATVIFANENQQNF